MPSLCSHLKLDLEFISNHESVVCHLRACIVKGRDVSLNICEFRAAI